MTFRSLADVARAVIGGEESGLSRIAIGGRYLMNAATDDGVVHLAWFDVKAHDDFSVLFRCRRLVVDGSAGALGHLRGPEDDVTCMACIASAVA